MKSLIAIDWDPRLLEFGAKALAKAQGRRLREALYDHDHERAIAQNRTPLERTQRLQRKIED